MISDDLRIRVVRAIIGMNCQEFASALLVTVNTLNNWEQGKTSPQPNIRKRLNRLCQRYKIRFLPSGMPVPLEDYRKLKSQKRLSHADIVKEIEPANIDQHSLRAF